jgi:hypothetical protein
VRDAALPHGRGFAHFSRTITLTRDAPGDAELGIHLLRVEPDGTTVIKVDKTGETMTARPGEYIRGDQRPFGRIGLFLQSSESDGQSAVFIRNWAEHG